MDHSRGLAGPKGAVLGLRQRNGRKGCSSAHLGRFDGSTEHDLVSMLHSVAIKGFLAELVGQSDGAGTWRVASGGNATARTSSEASDSNAVFTFTFSTCQCRSLHDRQN